MAQHRSTVLPVKRALRSYALAALHRGGSVVWQTAAAEIVESRETWPDGTTGLAETPNNPAVFGWQRLTPS